MREELTGCYYISPQVHCCAFPSIPWSESPDHMPHPIRTSLKRRILTGPLGGFKHYGIAQSERGVGRSYFSGIWTASGAPAEDNMGPSVAFPVTFPVTLRDNRYNRYRNTIKQTGQQNIYVCQFKRQSLLPRIHLNTPYYPSRLQ